MKATFGFLASILLGLSLAACGSSPTSPKSPRYGAGTGMAAMAGSVKGSGGDRPAVYDGRQITINSLELADNAGDHIVQNKSHNEIYVTNDLDDPQDFMPVLDAIQGDGFNPLWEQIKIVFNPGVTPRQFFSDTEVLAAAAGASPEITLVDTGELYRCSVVGTKK